MMKMPDCFYQKAFWIVIVIMISVVTSVMGLAWGMILDNRQQALENKIELEKRAEPISLIPIIYKNQIIICTSLGVNCE